MNRPSRRRQHTPEAIEARVKAVLEIAIDTSAVIATLRLEPEAAMVLAGPAAEAVAWSGPDIVLKDMEAEVFPRGFRLPEPARAVFLRYGTGRHPARLNCGDCAVCALAKSHGIPLLFKGSGSAQTVIVPAVPAPA